MIPPLTIQARCAVRRGARSLAIAGAAALLLASSAGQAQTTSEALGLAGPVASVDRYQEYPGTTERRLVRRWSFREDGVATEAVYLAYSFMDGSLRSRRVTHYDDTGMPLATVESGPDDEPMGQVVYRYDGEGRMAEQATYDAEGGESRRIAYERNARGKVVAQETFVDGSLFRRVERQLDAQGRLLEERRFDGAGNLIEVETYTEPDRVHDFVQYDESGAVEATGMVREGEHGTISMVSHDADGELQYEFAWRYDEDGREIERREERDGEVTVYANTYVLDERGNWIRRERTEDMGAGPQPYEVVDREITYH